MKSPEPRPGGPRDLLHSIRFRLTLWFVFILALVLALFSGVIYWTQSRSLRSDVARRLEDRGALLQGALAELVNEGEVENPTVSALLSAERPSADEVLILTNASGAVLGTWGHEIERPAQIAKSLLGDEIQAAEPLFLKGTNTEDADGESRATELALLASPISYEGRVTGYLIVGRDSDVAAQQQRLAISLASGSLGMLVVAFLGGLWIADRAMRPVSAITRAARSIGETDLGRRLDLPGRDELAALAATFDAMLARLQGAFDRQRRFVADSSHELRTPLAIINLESERALERDRRADEYRASLRVIGTEGRRMARLVDDLLMLARMEAGQMTLELRPLDLGRVAGEAVRRFEGLALQRGVRLIGDAMPSAMIVGDEQYLLRAISNLVDNGIKYAGGGNDVRLELLKQGEQVSLRVSDTGKGVPAEHLPLLFDRFHQVEAARSRDSSESGASSGSGLGLSIAKSIIEAHHGRIRVESALNMGTTFEVTLPLSGQ